MEEHEENWYKDLERDDYYDEYASPNYNPDGDMEEARYWKLQIGDAVYYIAVGIFIIWLLVKIW